MSLAKTLGLPRNKGYVGQEELCLKVKFVSLEIHVDSRSINLAWLWYTQSRCCPLQGDVIEDHRKTLFHVPFGNFAKSRTSEQCFWRNWTSLLNIEQFMYAIARDRCWQSNDTKIVTNAGAENQFSSALPQQLYIKGFSYLQFEVSLSSFPFSISHSHPIPFKYFYLNLISDLPSGITARETLLTVL